MATGLWQKFDKSAFYHTLATGDVDEIDEELNVISAALPNGHEAYEGILLMRKAGLVPKPKDKLHYFKSGRIKFQTAFMADSNNTEFRFLRLGIQEHAPKIVKYRSDIKADKDFIIAHFKGLSSVVQHAIVDYSKTSKVLHPQDF